MNNELAITVVRYDKKDVTTTTCKNIEEISEVIKNRGTLELWIDICCEDIKEILKKFGIEPTMEDYVIEDEEGRTVFGFPYVLRGVYEKYYIYIVTATDLLMTFRAKLHPKGPCERTIAYIDDLVGEETDDGKVPIQSFRDFVFVALLGAYANELIASIENLTTKLDKSYEGLIRDVEPMSIQESLYKVHSYLSDEFSTTIFIFREFLSMIRKGTGRYMRIGQYGSYIDNVISTINQAIQMRGDADRTVELLSNTIRAKLSDKNIENTARLNFAVELLTRASVLLMIPNSVFTFWPTLPIKPTDTFLCINSVGWELIIATLLTIVSQILISFYYKKSIGRVFIK